MNQQSDALLHTDSLHKMASNFFSHSTQKFMSYDTVEQWLMW